jgi:signal transduction histidine kinase
VKLITKLLVIVLGTVTGMVLLGGFAVTSLHGTMLQERQQSMELLVRMATSQVEHFVELEKSGKLSRENAQAAAKDVLRSLRDGENYVFVRGGEKLLMMIVHPDPRREGQESNGGVLASGLSLTEVYLQGLQNGNGNTAFVSVMTNRPNGDDLLPKISAVQRIPEWNWLIGSGDFVDDIDKAFWSYVIEFLVIGSAVLVAVVALAFVLARGILKQLGGEPYIAAESMQKIANGDLTVENTLSNGDQTSLMASLKLMQMKLKNITAAIYENTSSLDEQIQSFTNSAKTYTQSKLEEDRNKLLQSIQNLWKSADILVKSVSRLKS